jgi:hypothetical protein
VETLIEQPALMSFYELDTSSARHRHPREPGAHVGGHEDVNDLIADLKQAFAPPLEDPMSAPDTFASATRDRSGTALVEGDGVRALSAALFAGGEPAVTRCRCGR